jgi:DNA-binding CsgD family transcriptional regulator
MSPVADVMHVLAVAARSGLDPFASSGSPPGPPVSTRAMVPAVDGGWLLLEAAPLLGRGDRVAVTAQPAGRGQVGETLLRAYGLTPRETDVALAVLRNETTSRIASSLHVSPWTVQDHLKAIFAKTGVRTRRDLAVQLFKPPAHHRRNER